jgi:hypothetical protein
MKLGYLLSGMSVLAAWIGGCGSSSSTGATTGSGLGGACQGQYSWSDLIGSPVNVTAAAPECTAVKAACSVHATFQPPGGSCTISSTELLPWGSCSDEGMACDQSISMGGLGAGACNVSGFRCTCKSGLWQCSVIASAEGAGACTCGSTDAGAGAADGG